MANDSLEELNDSLAQSDVLAAEVPPESAGMPPMPPAPQTTRQAFPQLYRFFWGGLIVFVGALLPFGPAVVESIFGGDKDDAKLEASRTAADNKDLAATLGMDKVADAMDGITGASQFHSMPAFQTFTGAIFLLFGLMLMGQMYGAIQERKVKLGAVLVMFLVAGWCWFKAVVICNGLDWFSVTDLYLLNTFDRLSVELGSGFMLILGGSTYVALNFLGALFGAAKGPAKPAAAPARASRRR